MAKRKKPEKTVTSARHPITLEALAVSQIGTCFDEMLKELVLDCTMRWGLSKARTVTLEIIIAPFVDEKGFQDRIEMECKLKKKVPPHHTMAIECLADRRGELTTIEELPSGQLVMKLPESAGTEPRDKKRALKLPAPDDGKDEKPSARRMLKKMMFPDDKDKPTGGKRTLKTPSDPGDKNKPPDGERTLKLPSPKVLAAAKDALTSISE